MVSVPKEGSSRKKIEYEPKSCNIRYYDFLRKKECTYIPDFKVGNVCVEIKDLGSLGVQANYRWQKDREKVLIVNCSKAGEALEQFDDYRIYVYINGDFHRTYNFWERKEQKRLLALA